MQTIYDMKTKKIYGAYGLFLGTAENMEEFFEEYPDGQAVYGWSTYYKKDIMPSVESSKRKITLTFEA